VKISPDGIALIKRFEGCAKRRPDGRFEAYPDPGTGGDPWTIGWGATGPDIKRGTVWTQEECDARLLKDLERFEKAVAAMVWDRPFKQHQFDALVSFAYNVGPANLKSSTLLKKHRAGDYIGAAVEFLKWTHAGGKRLAGLVKRRSAEAALYSN
jgi:GH24 family phage-related lysozyme (muramidase)